MEAAKKVRDSYFDNYKAMLIILVVLGHAGSGLSSWFVPYAKNYIYLFHMPAFAFISGYFCKKFPPDYKKSAKQLLIPYFIFQSMNFAFSLFVWHKNFSKTYMLPAFTLWFLLSLFFWRAGLYLVKDIKFIIPISFFVAMFIGYDPRIEDYLALSRTFIFFPFFILGNRFDKERFMKYAGKWYIKLISLLVLIGLYFLTVYFKKDISFHVLTGATPYRDIEINFGTAWLYRGLVLLTGTLMIYLLGVLIPQKKTVFSGIGQNSMIIYLTHGIILRTIRWCTNWNDFFSTEKGVFVLIALVVLYSFLITSKPAMKLIGHITKGFWKLFDRFTSYMTVKKG